MTHTVTSWVGDHGVYAVFVLMLVGALLPAASEVTMIYAGAIASGALAAEVTLFGHPVETPAWAYVTMALAGVAGNLAGAGIGWAIGRFGGRPLLERHGRWFHVSQAKLARTDRWFARFGTWAVAIGFLTPLVRSFVAIPAGALRLPARRFFPAAVLGCVPFCFGLAGAGYALGAHWESFRHGFRFADYLVLALAAAVVVYLVARAVRRRAVRPSG